jgi:hypothetical protein
MHHGLGKGMRTRSFTLLTNFSKSMVTRFLQLYLPVGRTLKEELNLFNNKSRYLKRSIF